MQLVALAKQIGMLLQQKGWLLTTAESCTGGWIAQVVTAVAGASVWFERGFVTYSDQSKQDMLGVDAKMLHEHGAVSAEVVREMVIGAILHSNAEVGVAVSGIAGPNGGSILKPVGTVWLGWVIRNQTVELKQQIFAGDREQVRHQVVKYALQGLIDLLKNN